MVLIRMIQRQVTWILWSSITEIALIINPEEAEVIWPRLFGAKSSPTHLILYTASVTRKMTFFNRVNFYAIPAMPEFWKAPVWLAIELLLLSGGLYFDYDLYPPLRKYLGLHVDEATHGDQPDEDKVEEELGGTSLSAKPSSDTRSFTTKPLTFLQEWLSIRRKGQDFTHTPMGYVCQGKRLDPNHPFFVETDDIMKAKLANPSKPEARLREAGTRGQSFVRNVNADSDLEDEDEDDIHAEGQLDDDDILRR